MSLSSVLSVDVGIKHMAICIRDVLTNSLVLLQIVDVQKRQNLFEFPQQQQQQQNLDLSGIQVCEFENKRGKKCSRIIRSLTMIPSINSRVCDMCHKHNKSKTKPTYLVLMKNTALFFKYILEKYPEITSVIIEHQRKNNKTKMLATCIGTVGVVCNKNVVYAEPMDKFKPFIPGITKKEVKDYGYGGRKKKAVEVFKNTFKDINKVTELCKSEGIKMDDIADAYLQSFFS